MRLLISGPNQFRSIIFYSTDNLNPSSSVPCHNLSPADKCFIYYYSLYIISSSMRCGPKILLIYCQSTWNSWTGGGGESVGPIELSPGTAINNNRLWCIFCESIELIFIRSSTPSIIFYVPRVFFSPTIASAKLLLCSLNATTLELQPPSTRSRTTHPHPHCYQICVFDNKHSQVGGLAAFNDCGWRGGDENIPEEINGPTILRPRRPPET